MCVRAIKRLSRERGNHWTASDLSGGAVPLGGPTQGECPVKGGPASGGLGQGTSPGTLGTTPSTLGTSPGTLGISPSIPGAT